VLITVSGMVGSGKSTAVNDLVRLLEDRGIAATDVQFQSLPCFAYLGGRRRSRTARPAPSAQTQRWSKYRRRSLSVTAACTYVARIVAFQLYRWRSDTRCFVTNRYFYDNFVHYRLSSRLERFLAAVLRPLIPKPDLALLVVASPAEIRGRRPHYSPEYLAQVAGAYERLPERFPNLVVVRSDLPDRAVTQMHPVLERTLDRRT
jgi:thymidylate kinase